ncbi:MAG: energy transducer TonB [Candidatus Omnitrophica bacterium]|nr:energy transducer TonB [Candidatus Omnitrophota bacterium]
MSNRLFYICLIVSCLIHFSLINFLTPKRVFTPPRKVKKIEVTYSKAPSEKNKNQKPVVQKERKIIKAKPLKNEVKLIKKNEKKFSMFNQEVKDISKLSKKVSLDRKMTPSIKTFDSNRRISVDLIRSEKITNPKYISYNQTIWQRIRAKAYSYFDLEDFEEGQVYLTFIINASGELEALQIIEERTRADEYLRSVGMRSVKDSAPFPPFPSDLTFPQLTFNVVISFKDKDEELSP